MIHVRDDQGLSQDQNADSENKEHRKESRSILKVGSIRPVMYRR